MKGVGLIADLIFSHIINWICDWIPVWMGVDAFELLINSFIRYISEWKASLLRSSPKILRLTHF